MTDRLTFFVVAVFKGETESKLDLLELAQEDEEEGVGMLLEGELMPKKGARGVERGHLFFDLGPLYTIVVK